MEINNWEGWRNRAIPSRYRIFQTFPAEVAERPRRHQPQSIPHEICGSCGFVEIGIGEALNYLAICYRLSTGWKHLTSDLQWSLNVSSATNPTYTVKFYVNDPHTAQSPGSLLRTGSPSIELPRTYVGPRDLQVLQHRTKGEIGVFYRLGPEPCG